MICFYFFATTPLQHLVTLAQQKNQQSSVLPNFARNSFNNCSVTKSINIHDLNQFLSINLTQEDVKDTDNSIGNDQAPIFQGDQGGFFAAVAFCTPGHWEVRNGSFDFSSVFVASFSQAVECSQSSQIYLIAYLQGMPVSF